MKIIIAGGGIGGLAAYLALEKYLAEVSPSISIKVYESHSDPTSTTATIGGGLGLAPNGLRAMHALCDAAVEKITRTSFQFPTMTFRNAQGTLLGRKVTGRQERYGFDQVYMARASVHEALVKEVPESAVEWGKKVTRVRETGEGVEVEFENGSVEHADLVIGADGAKSTVREAIFGDGFKAEYQGLTGVGGFLPISSLSEELQESMKQDPITMTFGPHGFFGYAPSSSLDQSLSPTDESLLMWWSTYEVTPAPTRGLVLSDVRAQLLERHGYWKSPYDSTTGVFSSIISLACGTDDGNSELAVEKDILILPRYVLDRLPHWCSNSGRIILLGDAAHALPPDSGQGVSCAVEDGLAIALLLKHYLAQRPTSTVSGGLDITEVLRQTKTAYEAVRMSHIGMILDMAKRRGGTTKAKTWWEEWVRDWMLWILCKLPVSINDRIFGYSVEAEIRSYLEKPPQP